MCFLIKDKQSYEKVGESTEVALKVLAEKLNVQGINLASLSPKQRACACNNAIFEEYIKVYLSNIHTHVHFFRISPSSFHVIVKV